MNVFVTNVLPGPGRDGLGPVDNSEEGLDRPSLWDDSPPESFHENTFSLFDDGEEQVESSDLDLTDMWGDQ